MKLREAALYSRATRKNTNWLIIFHGNSITFASKCFQQGACCNESVTFADGVLSQL